MQPPIEMLSVVQFDRETPMSSFKAILVAMFVVSTVSPEALALSNDRTKDLLRKNAVDLWQEPFDHNGSVVILYPQQGLIVYDQPRASLRGTIKRGDVLFRGKINTDTGEMVGNAYVFKKGCPPLPYLVTGGPFRGGGDHPVLRGAAPVRDPNSCGSIGTSNSSGNATLKFEWIGGDI